MDSYYFIVILQTNMIYIKNIKDQHKLLNIETKANFEGSPMFHFIILFELSIVDCLQEALLLHFFLINKNQ